ncbi:DUF2642 domain-containing protein [Lysinibacillus sphaericus]|nr:DUF2642 domain-containing protein [Lysinibacillus sphaericus]
MSNPYLYETLKMMIGQAIVVQTEKIFKQVFYYPYYLTILF